MNLIYKIDTIYEATLGIIETPCFPNCYYVGRILWCDKGHEYYPASNSTNLFHPTIDIARKELSRAFELLRKNYQKKLELEALNSSS